MKKLFFVFTFLNIFASHSKPQPNSETFINNAFKWLPKDLRPAMSPIVLTYGIILSQSSAHISNKELNRKVKQKQQRKLPYSYYHDEPNKGFIVRSTKKFARLDTKKP